VNRINLFLQSPTSLSLSERLGGGNNTSHGVDHGGGGGGGGGGHDETGSNGAKDDEDDEDDESEDKMDTHQYDPERLKAFNVREPHLFDSESVVYTEKAKKYQEGIKDEKAVGRRWNK